MTNVIFRKDQRGEITAFFPDTYKLGELVCYQHIGQHSMASIGYYRKTKPALKKEYTSLLNELVNFVGYDDLVIRKRIRYRQESVL